MKTIFFFFLLLQAANTIYCIEINSKTKFNIIEEKKGGIEIVTMEINGITYYNVIASIATELIPIITSKLLNISTTTPTGRVVNLSIKTLCAIYKGQIKKEIQEGIEWIADKGNSTSRITYLTGSKENAEDIYSTISNIKNRSEINWDYINENELDRFDIKYNINGKWINRAKQIVIIFNMPRNGDCTIVSKNDNFSFETKFRVSDDVLYIDNFYKPIKVIFSGTGIMYLFDNDALIEVYEKS